MAVPLRLLAGLLFLATVAAVAPAGASAPAPAVCDALQVGEECEAALEAAEVRDLAAGWFHTCALLEDGVECWGLNDHGQAADFDGVDPVAVGAGAEGTCVLTERETVECWGADPPRKEGFEGTPVDLAVGAFHACVVVEDEPPATTPRSHAARDGGDVVCWGQDDHGETADREEGDALKVTAGSHHTCALLEGGVVECWGYDVDDRSEGHDGGSALDVEAGVETTCVLLAGGTTDCSGRDDKGQATDYTGGDAVQPAPGGTHVCVRLEGGDVHCDGSDRLGQAAGYDGGDARIAASGMAHSCVVDVAGDVHCWGDDRHGQSSPGEIDVLGLLD